MSGVLQDLRYAMRQLRKNPGFAAVAILTLALGIGVNTTIFSMVNGFLLRPLPYPEADRLAVLIRHQEGISSKTNQFVQEDDPSQDGETWEMIRDRVPSVRAASFGGTSGVNLVAGSAQGSEVRYVQDMRVSAHYFDVLGVESFLGRGFTEQEDQPGGPKAAILSYSLWQSALHGDSQIVGKTVRLKGEPHTVVGVLPRGAQTTGIADVWTPLQPHQSGECGGENCEIILRLVSGASWQQVATELTHVRKRWFDEAAAKNQGHAWFYASPLARNLDNGMRKPVLMLMLAVGMILLIACANLAGLTLVRMMRRAPELATRLALGATRWAILRQMWAENLLVALLGGLGGLFCAYGTLAWLSGFLPVSMIPLGGLDVDLRVLAFTFGASLFASLLFGALPAWQVRKIDLRSSISVGSHTLAQGSSRLRQSLVVVEVALTIVLLAGAGLLVRTLIHLQTLPSGFDATNVMTAKLSLDDASYRDAAAFQNLMTRSITAMRQTPNVEDAAVGLSLPYERGLNDGVRILDGKLAGKEWGASAAYVTAGYFSTLRIPILAGRAIYETDTTNAEPVTVINSDFAREFFGEPYPIGSHVKNEGHTYTVIGVAANVVKSPGMSRLAPVATEPVFYVPATQMDQGLINMAHVWFQPSWIVRTRPHVQDITRAMQNALSQVDPNLPFAGFYGMQGLLAEALAYQRVEVALLTTLAGLALLLSAIGIYGLVASLVAQRTREMGIRIALGSSFQRAMFDVGSSGLRAVVAGLLCGLVAALLAMRLLSSELYGIRYYDPATLAAIPFLILAVGFVASFLPTLRIARLDPVEALRSE